MKANKAFCEELAEAARHADSIEIEYVGMAWELKFQMADSAEIKVASVGEEELLYLEKHHKELFESRGIVWDEPDEEDTEDE